MDAAEDKPQRRPPGFPSEVTQRCRCGGQMVGCGGGRVRCKKCRTSTWRAENLVEKQVTVAYGPDGEIEKQWITSKPAPADKPLVDPVPEKFGIGKVSTQIMADGSVGMQWIQASPDAIETQKRIAEAVAASIEDLPKLRKRAAPKGDLRDDLMACYPIGDAHIGMLAWAEECGEDWDLKIAEQIQCAAVDSLVQSSPACERAVIVNLGDFLHYDNMEGTTARSGNVLDIDGRYSKMVRVAIKVIRQCIESALSKHKTVLVISAKGNHDETGALWLAAALSHIYEREPRVTVECSPAPFHYFEFGKCLVGVHHGDKCKPDGLPGVMAADKAEAWGRTEHRYWWLGHIHTQTVKEHPGVTVESFNTLAAKDAYATAGGWRARQNMKAIILHSLHGEVSRHTVNAQMFR